MAKQNEVTDFVLTNVENYDNLNAPDKALGEAKFKAELEKLLNRDDVDFKPLNSKVFECTQDGTTLPFIVKGPSLEFGNANECLVASKTHAELLGEEFVEAMSPIRITNPNSAEIMRTAFSTGMNEFLLPPETIDDIKEASHFDVFAQDRRGVESGVCIWEYIIRNYKTMAPEMRTKLTTLLERLRNAANQGYVFDLPVFPSFLGVPITQKNRDNLIVDQEGPTFIDSSTIWKYEPGEKLESGMIALGAQISLDLLDKKTTPEEACVAMKQGSQTLSNP